MENLISEQKDNSSRFLHRDLMLLIDFYVIMSIFLVIPAQMNIPKAEHKDIEGYIPSDTVIHYMISFFSKVGCHLHTRQEVRSLEFRSCSLISISKICLSYPKLLFSRLATFNCIQLGFAYNNSIIMDSIGMRGTRSEDYLTQYRNISAKLKKWVFQISHYSLTPLY